MTKDYELKMAGERLGTVTVREDGLYVHFSCRCNLCGDVMFHLMVHHEKGQENLGLLMPLDGRYGLDKRIPRKLLGQGSYDFYLQPRHKSVNEHFVPIRAEEPFLYLNQLEQAVMVVRHGQTGILLPSEK